MRKILTSCFSLLFLAGSVLAVDPQGKIVKETWDVAYLEGGKAGYVHTVVREIEKDGKKIHKTVSELKLTLKRFKDIIELRMESGTDEDAEGRVVAIYMKQYLGKEQKRVMVGTVKGKQLHLLVDGGKTLDKKVPWNDDVVGLYRQERLFKEQNVKPGNKFSYKCFEPTVTAVITTNVVVKDYEMIELHGKKQRMLRVEATPEKIEGVSLPPLISWLNKDLVPMHSEGEIPGLGKLKLYRTTREFAMGGKPVDITDIGRTQLVPVNRKINKPYETKSAVYKITVKGEKDAGTTFARDGRQTVKNVKGETFELHVSASHGPKLIDKPGDVGAEFMKSCYFIKSDDVKVKEHAAKAVGKEKDPWKKAQMIEKWVHDNMKNKNFTEAFATADHVARTLEGDCTEHAVLAAAMCRAAGIPSRTAIGLIYADIDNRHVMVFHMWAEVWVKGQWLSIDGTLGHGYVGATHLKISDHSWNEMQSLTPLLPVVRVLGKLKIEVESVK